MSGINQQFNTMLRDALNTSENASKAQIKELLYSEMREKIGRQSAYNFDYPSITFPKLETKQKEFMESYFFKNDLFSKLIKTVKNAADNGISGMLERVGANSIITQNVYIYNNPVYYLDVLQEVYLTEELIDIDKYDKDNLAIMKLYLNQEGKYVLSHIIVPKDDNGNFQLENGMVQRIEVNGEEVNREYVYQEWDYSPLTILENNESAKGDWEYANTTMRLNAKFNSIIEQEWEYTKIQLLNNMMYNTEKTGAEVQAGIENGVERVYDVNDPDGKLQSALTYLSSGGITTDIARAIKENYKEEIQELVFSFTAMSGGNNKHTTEAVMSNVDAFKYLFIKKEYFHIFLQKLTWKILDMSSSIKGDITYDEDMIVVNFKLSKILEMMINPVQTKPAGNAETKKAIGEE